MTNRIISLVRKNQTVHCTATSMRRGGEVEHKASIDSVLTAGDWSSLRTFNKHYNRMHKSLP